MAGRTGNERPVFMVMRSFIRSLTSGALLRGRAGAGGIGRFGTRPRGFGLWLTALLFGATGAYGAAVGDRVPALTTTYGTPGDILANLVGFRVNTVTISGQSELSDARIFAAAGVSSTSSLLFLDTAAARDGLQALPLVKSAQVRKLYPDTLAITVEERRPYALWQLNGAVSIIADDGTMLDSAVPARFFDLPMIVGAGADRRATEIVSLLEKVPALRKQVKAASLVAMRRWNLALANGVVVRLPETGADRALATLAAMDAKDGVLGKDILSVDMRVDGRVVFRLSAEAAATRAANLAKKPKKGDSA